MFRFIYRQRRRLLVGGLFTWLSLFVWMIQQEQFAAVRADAERFFWLSLVLATLIFALVAMAVYAVFIAIFRRWRHLVELLPTYFFISISAAPAVTALGLPDMVLPFAWFAGWMLFWTLTYGNGLDRFRASLSWRSRRSTNLPLPPGAVWRKFETRADMAKDHWSPLVHSARAIQDAPGRFEVEYRLGPSIFQHQVQTVLNSDPGRHFRYHFAGDVTAANRGLADGIFDVRVAPAEEGSRIDVEQTQEAMLPRLALQMWFDDILGDQLDNLWARLAGRRDWSITGLVCDEILGLS